ncbi:hypothetical protein WA158_006596 [Blastocystis sp. Blastoise]
MSLKEEFDIPEQYKVISKIGKGAYGIVAKGYDHRNKRHIAIKKEAHIFQSVIDARRMYRELYLMEKMDHPCILKLYDISTPCPARIDEIYLYEELLDTDLYSFIYDNGHLSHKDILYITYQMVCGLHYMHHRHVIHRDLKPSNILINKSNLSVRLCDFGLSRIVDNEDIYRYIYIYIYTQDEYGEKTSVESRPKLLRQLTQHVVTRWYRAPEIICMNKYGAKIDVWSLGCLFAELLMALEDEDDDDSDGERKKGSLFNGKPCAPLSPTNKKYAGKDQLNMILSYIGTPNEEDLQWIEQEEFKDRIRESAFPKVEWSNVFPNATVLELDFLDKMLQFNPNKRYSASECLHHPIFDDIRDYSMEVTTDEPLPTIKIDLTAHPTRDEVEEAFLQEFRHSFPTKSNNNSDCSIF